MSNSYPPFPAATPVGEDYDDHRYIIHGAPTGHTPPVYALNVSDVVAMATAGVKIDFDQVKSQVRPDAPKRKEPLYDHTYLLQPLYDRLRMAAELASTDPMMHAGGLWHGPRHMSATVHHDKVHVFIHAQGEAPVIIEDEKHMYPSDALMAKIALLCKLNEKPSPENDQIGLNAMPQTGRVSRRFAPQP